MVAVTVSGSVNGTTFSIPTNAALQTALVQQILNAAASGTGSQTATGPATLSAAIAFDTSLTGGILTGTTAISTAQIVLGAAGGQGQIYVNNGTAVSTVVAADNSNSTIVNDNAAGAIVGQTGSGANQLLGLAGQNNFFTGNGGGNDFVVLNGSINNLTSRGADGVLVGGPSTIVASAGGVDRVVMTAATQLAFVNQSRMPDLDSITGAANGSIVLAGTGNTSITSGAGPETFFIDTSAGNTTLNLNSTANDAVTFIKNATTATANIVVNSFVTSDIVQVHGYAGFNVTASASAPAGSTLVLSDGSQVTFSNVSVATLQQTVKVV